MAYANWRLENPPPQFAFHASMGLLVVGRLAARHGIRVRLQPAPGRRVDPGRLRGRGSMPAMISIVAMKQGQRRCRRAAYGPLPAHPERLPRGGAKPCQLFMLLPHDRVPTSSPPEGHRFFRRGSRRAPVSSQRRRCAAVSGSSWRGEVKQSHRDVSAVTPLSRRCRRKLLRLRLNLWVASQLLRR
jgi:hypothetical protein